MRRFRVAALPVVALLVSAALPTGEVPDARATGTTARPALAPTQGAPSLISVDGNGADDPNPDAFSTVSSDGQVITFSVRIPNPDTFTQQVWVRDRTASTTTVVPFTSDTRAGTMSRDGCTIAFWGLSVDGEFFAYRVQVWNRCTGDAVRQLTSPAPSVAPPGDRSLDLSADGTALVWANATGTVGITDTAADTTQVVPGTTGGVAATSANVEKVDISDDGNTAVFSRTQTIRRVVVSQVFAWTRATNAVETVSQDQGTTYLGYSPTVSADGRFVAFITCADNAAPQVLTVRDRVAGTTTYVTPPGGDATGNAYVPDITPDGSQIAVVYNGVSGCGLGGARGREVVSVVRSTQGVYNQVAAETISHTPDGSPALGENPSISTTGRFVTFDSSQNEQLQGQPPPSESTFDLNVWMTERIPQLTATSTLNLGTVNIGGTSAPVPITVTNTSGVLVPITSVTPPTNGFQIAQDTCTGVVLLPTAACTVAVVFRPTDVGPATSTVVVNGDGTTTTTNVRGTGRPAPRLVMNPGVVSSGGITFAVGTGFPPNRTVVLTIDGQPFTTTKSDGTGAFRASVLVLVNATVRIGGHQVQAVDQPSFKDVHAPLVVAAGRVQPVASTHPTPFDIGPGVVGLPGRGG